MRTIKQKVDAVLGWVLIVAMAVSVLTVLWQVFTRYVLGDPSAWTDELVRYLLVWIGLLGAAYATGQRLHLAIDLLPSRLEGAARQRLLALIQLLVATFALLVMTIGGGQLVHLSFLLGQTSATLGVPLGYVYLVLPLSGLLVMFYSLLFCFEHLSSSRPSRSSRSDTGCVLPPSKRGQAGEVSEYGAQEKSGQKESSDMRDRIRRARFRAPYAGALASLREESSLCAKAPSTKEPSRDSLPSWAQGET